MARISIATDLVHEHRVSGGVDVVKVHLQVVVRAVSGWSRETTHKRGFDTTAAT